VIKQASLLQHAERLYRHLPQKVRNNQHFYYFFFYFLNWKIFFLVLTIKLFIAVIRINQLPVSVARWQQVPVVFCKISLLKNNKIVVKLTTAKAKVK
jgi:hypothetical protein